MTSGIKTVVFREFDMLDDKTSSSGLVLLTNIVYQIPDNIERFKFPRIRIYPCTAMENCPSKVMGSCAKGKCEEDST